jgi:Mn2+/Fe2+ NRAMP family transporter
MFLPYLVLWSFFVGSALIAACGATLHALLPVHGDPVQGKVVFGTVSSLVALVLVWVGGYRLFEKVMSACIILMFVTVVTTAGLLWPGTGAVLQGLLIPRAPAPAGEGITWTVALIGGVGGTLTILCYGYWIREERRLGLGELAGCRLDLALGYVMTAVFGIAMVIVGSSVVVHGSGAALLVTLAERLQVTLGRTGRLLFLLGALGAVFSSLLGVWQAVPYLFADIWRLFLHPGRQDVNRLLDTRAAPYRLYLLALALVPLAGLFMGFRQVQKLYAVVGAAFIPLLALLLLWFNGRAVWVGSARNGWRTTLVLGLALVLFGWLAAARFF